MLVAAHDAGTFASRSRRSRHPCCLTVSRLASPLCFLFFFFFCLLFHLHDCHLERSSLVNISPCAAHLLLFNIPGMVGSGRARARTLKDTAATLKKKKRVRSSKEVNRKRELRMAHYTEIFLVCSFCSYFAVLAKRFSGVQTGAIHLQSKFSSSEIDSIFAVEKNAWQLCKAGKFKLCNETRKFGQNTDNEKAHGHKVTYLHKNLYLSYPSIMSKLQSAAFEADKDVWDMSTELYLRPRCVELIRYLGRGDTRSRSDSLGWHSDSGSYLTIAVMLSSKEEYEGGTFEYRDPVSKNIVTMNELQKGDMMVWKSWVEHRVKPITKGARSVLVVEFWSEPENTQDNDGRPAYDVQRYCELLIQRIDNSTRALSECSNALLIAGRGLMMTQPERAKLMTEKAIEYGESALETATDPDEIIFNAENMAVASMDYCQKGLGNHYCTEKSISFFQRGDAQHSKKSKVKSSSLKKFTENVNVLKHTIEVMNLGAIDDIVKNFPFLKKYWVETPADVCSNDISKCRQSSMDAFDSGDMVEAQKWFTAAKDSAMGDADDVVNLARFYVELYTKSMVQENIMKSLKLYESVAKKAEDSIYGELQEALYDLRDIITETSEQREEYIAELVQQFPFLKSYW